ncbi:MAG: YccF domain-containing protein [Culicoidibacterales bacterium]
MTCLGNFIWWFLGGFFGAITWWFFGILWSITIIGLPIGKQCFKMARLQFAPFGKEVVTVDDSKSSFFLNILWLIFGGLELALVNLISAVLLTISIIGIPFAIQSLKLAKLSLMPFGKDIVAKID